MRSLAFLICAATLAACSGAPGAAAQTDTAARTMTVSGTGEVTVAPDMAVVTIGVETQAATAAEALRANSAEMTAAMEQLETLGVAEKDMQTANLSVRPRYDYEGDRRSPKITGYNASNTLRVKLRDLSAAGAVIDAAVQAGANRLSSIAFGLSDPHALLDEARVKAVAEARNKAALYARAADVRLVRILSIQDGYANAPSPPPMRVRAMTAEADSVPVAAGETTVSASIQIVYEIE